MSIYWLCYCTLLVYVVNYFFDSVFVILRGRESVQVCYCMFLPVLSSKPNYQELRVKIPFTPKLLCAYPEPEPRFPKPNLVVFSEFNCLRWLFVFFVNISGLVDHHCLNLNSICLGFFLHDEKKYIFRTITNYNKKNRKKNEAKSWLGELITVNINITHNALNYFSQHFNTRRQTLGS